MKTKYIEVAELDIYKKLTPSEQLEKVKEEYQEVLDAAKNPEDPDHLVSECWDLIQSTYGLIDTVMAEKEDNGRIKREKMCLSNSKHIKKLEERWDQMKREDFEIFKEIKREKDCSTVSSKLCENCAFYMRNKAIGVSQNDFLSRYCRGDKLNEVACFLSLEENFKKMKKEHIQEKSSLKKLHQEFMESRKTQEQYNNESGIDPFSVMKASSRKVSVYEGFMLGSLIKYLMREKDQDEKDLEKVVDYSHLLLQDFLDNKKKESD